MTNPYPNDEAAITAAIAEIRHRASRVSGTIVGDALEAQASAIERMLAAAPNRDAEIRERIADLEKSESAMLKKWADVENGTRRFKHSIRFKLRAEMKRYVKGCFDLALEMLTQTAPKARAERVLRTVKKRIPVDIDAAIARAYEAQRLQRESGS
jgi:hypothetical protein